MPLRLLAAATASTPLAGQVIEQIAELIQQNELAKGGDSFVQTDTLAGMPIAEVVKSPAQALNEVTIAVRSETENVIFIEGLQTTPAPSFDVLGWNFDVAANVGANVILVLDASGMSEELLADEIRLLLDRAAKHHATVSGLVVTGATGTDLPAASVPVLHAPLTAQTLATISGQEVTVTTPLMFQTDLLAKASILPQTIVLPEPEDDRVLEATAKLLAKKVANITLVGDATSIQSRAEKMKLDIAGANIVSPQDPQLVEKYAAEFARLRAHKGVTLDQARQKMADVSYFATMMVQMGDADGMVSGAIHTTADTIVPAFQIIKTQPGISVVSSAFLMLMSDHVLVMGDCAVNPSPNPDQLAQIAISTAQTARQFGVDPKVAMLSYSTGTSGSGAAVEAVAQATAKVREMDPFLPIEGPIQYDAAVDETVGQKKAPGSLVAGHANVLIYPDLNAGNIAYKAVQRSADAVAVGPILQGLRRPVNDLSRGALVEDIVNTVAITAVQAQSEGNN